MVFANKIAGFVHTVVDRWGGSTNKNLGEAFLLVWRLWPPTRRVKVHSRRERDAKESPGKKGVIAKMKTFKLGGAGRSSPGPRKASSNRLRDIDRQANMASLK